MEPYELPEVRRVDLCGTVLALHAWGKPDPRAFGWFEAPPERVFGYLNDFHRWSAWSPWERLDPAMQRSFSGAALAPGE